MIIITVLDYLELLQTQYQKLREDIYSDSFDEPYLSDAEFMKNTPDISAKEFKEFEENIVELNELLNSGLLSEIHKLIDLETPINKYVNLDEMNFQMEYIQNSPDAFDEGLSEVQEAAASALHERKSDLWDEASEDMKRLFEELLPILFSRY